MENDKGKKIESGLKYTEKHEWVRIEGDIVYCGITDFAQNSLGDMVFVEFTDDIEGENIVKGDTIAVVESSKAASDVYSPVSGEVLEVNTLIEDTPETLNSDPYGDGWFIKLKPAKSDELNSLLSAEEYEKLMNSGE